ncbi:MAG: hypothetical protein LIO87_09205 [Eubacterium sp.]|nr:hypothetical protein [Eubacterium sp.]
MNEREKLKRQEKAKRLRYKRPLAKDFNVEAITNDLNEMYWACTDIKTMYGDEPIYDELIDVFDGDDEGVREFEIAFSDLYSDIEKLQQDLEDSVYAYIGNDFEYEKENVFDLIFAVFQNVHGQLLGFDTYIGDYFSLSDYEAEAAMEEASKKLERLTKKELIKKVQVCGAVMLGYVGIKSRYEDLSAAIDILRAKNVGLSRAIKNVAEAYEKAERESEEFRFLWKPAVLEYDRLLDALPEEVWIR